MLQIIELQGVKNSKAHAIFHRKEGFPEYGRGGSFGIVINANESWIQVYASWEDK
jgi:hypothetical protein